MSVRAYLPATSTGLAAFVGTGSLAAPLAAHASTPELRAAWPEGDEEQWEYAALMAAAAASAAARGPADRPRRYVLAVDVAAVRPLADPEDPTAVRLEEEVTWSRLAAVLADGSDDAAADDDLGWYAVQEAAQLL